MTRWTEGILALVIILAFGLGMRMFVGDIPGSGGTTTTTPTELDPEAVARGETVANTAGCLLCHSVDGSSEGTGPTFKGLYGSSRPLVGGAFVTADETYLLNSIVDPGAQIVEGFDDVMPAAIASTLTDQEIEDIVEFIRSLS